MSDPSAYTEQIWHWLDEVKDPEIPVLSLIDLGVIQEVTCTDGRTEVVIIPTYSGCPAMKEMEADIVKVLHAHGVTDAKVHLRLSPAWTTDMITERGLKALEAYGIAPPPKATADKGVLLGRPHMVRCPQCRSGNTEMISQFGSTPCKALYRCVDCREPFDHFKCI
jgi:ring-1,2-phenylacetyl-CoA epoxidase subunit PaaD